MNVSAASKPGRRPRPFPKTLESQKPARPFTYRDFKSWGEDVHCELIDGVVYLMGAPTGMHQGLSMELSAIFHDFLDDKPCRVYAAPYDVRLFAPLEADKDKENDKTVVEPDLVVVCDEKKRHPEACHGAPDLVIEILSPGTRALDLKYKFDKYLEAGVREYWVIDPDKRTILVYTLSGEKKKRFFDPYMYKEEDTVPVGIFNGALKISMKELFAKAERY